MAYRGYESARRLLIIRNLFCEYSDRSHIITREQINKVLESNECEPIDRKTLYNDINHLEDVFDLHILYDAKKHGYFLQNPPFESYELTMMIDAVQSTKFLPQKQVDTITSKIRSLVGGGRKSELNRNSLVMNRVRNNNESVVKDATRIHDAIDTDSKISFQYFHFTPNTKSKKSYSKNGDRYVVSPFALLWNNGNYYLYAYVSEKKEFRFFRVDRMEYISYPLSEKRDGKSEYNEKSLLHQKTKVFDMYSGPQYNVSVRFHNRVASTVIDQFGKDIVMIPVDDNHFTTTLNVEVSPPFYSWLATLGHSAKILSPSPVVEGMIKFLENSLEMYKEEG